MRLRIFAMTVDCFSLSQMSMIDGISLQKYRIPIKNLTIPLAKYRKFPIFTLPVAIYYIEAHNILYSPPRYTILRRAAQSQ